jgi:hypothetical protein
MLVTLWCIRLFVPLLYPLQSRKWYCSLGNTWQQRSRSSIGGRLQLPQSVSFMYFGVFFDARLGWGAQARYVQKRCLQRLNLLEYGSVCYPGVAKTGMLRLERVQNRAISIALKLIFSAPNNSLRVLSGIAPLAERCLYLN